MTRTLPRTARRRVAPLLLALGLLLTACNGDGTTADGDTDDTGTSGSSDDGTGADDPPTDDEADGGDADPPAQAEGDDSDLPAEPVDGSGTATITFADGSGFTTDVTCTIGARELAGREVLYTATTPEPARFDLTIYGEGGAPVDPVLTITDDDGLRASAGGPLARDSLTVDGVGATITGSGTFTPGRPDQTDVEGPTREGEITVECG